ncbi:MAG: EamA family transporter [Limisphaerales bacterium]
MYLLLPLLAAIAFAAGSLVFKRAFAEGATLGHAVVLNNVVLGLAFLPLLALDPFPVKWSLLHQPAMAALAFVIGHFLHVLSLRLGDVSLATPLLGAKTVFVTLLAWFLFGWPLSTAQWAAAGLTTAGVLVMGLTDFRPGRSPGRTTALALGCAAAFAFTDVLIQHWAADVGVLNFLALMFAALALLSLGALPWLGPAELRAPAAAWPWIGGAIALSAVQAVLITWAIGRWRDAAGVNVVYGTRGLWSLALVWWAGRWFGNKERADAGRRVIIARLIGAVLLLAAVGLAMGAAK